jgi:ABC-type phosphate transport system substrate-binding protein
MTFGTPLSAFAELAVIVHPESPLSSAELEDVKKLFLGKTKSIGSSGTLLPIDVDAASPARAAFAEKVVEKSEAELKQYWSRLVFTGKATPPRAVGDDQAVKAMIAQNRNAIGIVPAALADSGVKTITKIK